jgi:acetyl esterase/lipase
MARLSRFNVVIARSRTHCTMLTVLSMQLAFAGALPAAGAPELDLTPGERAVRERLSPDEFELTTIRLWPDQGPDEPRPIAEETVGVAERGGMRITNVTRPSITVARPKNTSGAPPAIVVCPGGGYGSLGIDSGGVDVITWLKPLGIAGVYMKYRVPKRHNGYPMHHQPLQDIQRAVSVLRGRAEELRIDPNRIGVIGFSAGGHLAAMLSTNHQQADRIYEPIDDADQISCRPDFAAMVAPAYLTNPIVSDQLDPALKPDGIARNVTPPTFITSAVADKFTIGSCHYILALQAERVPAELHVYEAGGHAEGIHDGPDNQWPHMFEDWMRRRGLIGSTAQ